LTVNLPRLSKMDLTAVKSVNIGKKSVNKVNDAKNDLFY
jgi:hypothetical protein